jgi:anti-sigma B factor antagonist
MESSLNGKRSPGDIVGDLRERLTGLGALVPEQLVIGVWQPEDKLCVVALGGEMDMNNADKLRKELSGRVPSGPYRLIIELSRLTFIDSTGIRVVAEVAEENKANGGATVLAGPTPQVARVLEIVKLEEVIPIAASLDEAIGRLGEPTGAQG